jgi:hypothetical protein
VCDIETTKSLRELGGGQGPQGGFGAKRNKLLYSGIDVKMLNMDIGKSYL